MVHAVNKPWGQEYLLFQNDDVAIWHLTIDPYQATSMHSHPNKKTGLVILDGAAKVSFLSGHEKLFCGEKVMIRQGVFHRTMSMTSSPLHLLEIETPVDKCDIVRLEDYYGREGTTNMGKEGKEVSPINYLNDTLGKCNIKYMELKTGMLFDFNHFMITEGKISHMTNEVCGPGDIVSLESLNKLLKEFDHDKQLYGIGIKCLIY
jgi:mannose-6-phosphate isomerase-like protein (cupin superfamily)